MQTSVDKCKKIKILFDSRKIDTYPHFVVVAIMQQ